MNFGVHPRGGVSYGVLWNVWLGAKIGALEGAAGAAGRGEKKALRKRWFEVYCFQGLGRAALRKEFAA